MDLKQTLALYNAIPNLLWSILNLLPISVFCYSYVELKLFYIHLAAGLFTLFLPRSFFNAIQLSKTVSVYRSLGVHLMNRYTQNGTIINQLIKRRFPDYKVVSKRSVSQLVGQSYMLEKFHFMMFTLFVIIAFHALVRQYYGWALILFFNNIIYNVYPCLLQQFIRVKLNRAKN